MDNNRTKMDALAFVYDTIHGAGSRTWLRALTNGQVEDLARIIAAWEEKKHPSFRPGCAPAENTGAGAVSELRQVEKAAILSAVETLGVRRAAAALGLGKTTIYRKLRSYENEASIHSSSSALAEGQPKQAPGYRMQ